MRELYISLPAACAIEAGTISRLFEVMSNKLICIVIQTVASGDIGVVGNAIANSVWEDRDIT